jgi:hypothetical protein
MVKKPKKKSSTVIPRNSQVQLRNENVGMFSGPRPSYQRYSTSFAARDAVLGTGNTNV